ncbi:MAG: class II aldolase/adducin family protein [Stellaceae bacterium]
MAEEFEHLIADLVSANRILAHENVVDAYGHVSVRHPARPDRFFLSRARAPELIEAGDVMEFTLEGEALDAKGRQPYLERFIHGAIYEARGDIHSVVHSHSVNVIPFGVTGTKLRPVMHTCAQIGHEVPIWDIQAKFGDTNMLVTDMAMGRDLAAGMAASPTALMRGHGAVSAAASIREAVYVAVYLNVNAELQMKAAALGPVTFLSPGEIDRVNGGRRDRKPYVGVERAWEYWCRRAGVAYRPLGA